MAFFHGRRGIFRHWGQISSTPSSSPPQPGQRAPRKNGSDSRHSGQKLLKSCGTGLSRSQSGQGNSQSWLTRYLKIFTAWPLWGNFKSHSRNVEFASPYKAKAHPGYGRAYRSIPENRNWLTNANDYLRLAPLLIRAATRALQRARYALRRRRLMILLCCWPMMNQLSVLFIFCFYDCLRNHIMII